MEYKLPVDYTNLHWMEVKEVRLQYIKEQNNICFYCGGSLSEPPISKVSEKQIDWSQFPKDFLKNSIHLQHNHDTGMTEGAVHSYCNAVMWQYENR